MHSLFLDFQLKKSDRIGMSLCLSLNNTVEVYYMKGLKNNTLHFRLKLHLMFSHSFMCHRKFVKIHELICGLTCQNRILSLSIILREHCECFKIRRQRKRVSFDGSALTLSRTLILLLKRMLKAFPRTCLSLM